MPRTIRALLLSAAALGALTTAAIAAPTAPMGHGSAGGMPGTHAAGTTQLHTASAGMAQMHTAMMTDPAIHDSMRSMHDHGGLHPSGHHRTPAR